MGWKLIAPIAAALVCGAPAVATAQAKPANTAAGVSAKELTREQFQALPPDAVIEINGERITKSAFQARNAKAVEDAAKRLPELQARARADFETRRKALLNARAAALAAANKKLDAEVTKQVGAEAAAHGPDWKARQKQATDLLKQAEKASPIERSELEGRAADLLAPPAAK